MKRLCRKLDIPIYQAMGILECLWHLTATEAWRGDIGKLSDEDIALALDYREDPEELVCALVDSKWLDKSDEFRLVVHDWHEHSDDATDNRVARSLQTYANGKMPRMSRLGKDERAKLTRLFEEKEIRAHVIAQNPTEAHKIPLPEPVPEPEPVGKAEAPLARETLDHFEGMELQIANDLFREFRIPAEATLTRIAGQALVFECDRLGGAEKALNSMRVAMKEAKARGETINRFWFQDQKYDTSKVAEVKDAINKRTSPASDRVNGGLAELAEVRRRAGFGPNARADGPAVSPSGPEAIAGGLLPGLHRAGAEIWDRGSPPGAARVPRDAGPEILPPAK